MNLELSNPAIVPCDERSSFDGMRIIELTRMKPFDWATARIELYTDPVQAQRHTTGYHVWRALANKNVLGASVLDFLLGNETLIPVEWRGERIAFWGTIFCEPAGRPCIRYMHCLGRAYDYSWAIDRAWLDEPFHEDFMAAILLAN